VLCKNESWRAAVQRTPDLPKWPANLHIILRLFFRLCHRGVGPRRATTHFRPALGRLCRPTSRKEEGGQEGGGGGHKRRRGTFKRRQGPRARLNVVYQTEIGDGTPLDAQLEEELASPGSRPERPPSVSSWP